MFESAWSRYSRDAQYHAMVDAIYHSIVSMKLTPTEVREAAMLACIKFEESRPRSFLYLDEESA